MSGCLCLYIILYKGPWPRASHQQGPPPNKCHIDQPSGSADRGLWFSLYFVIVFNTNEGLFTDKCHFLCRLLINDNKLVLATGSAVLSHVFPSLKNDHHLELIIVCIALSELLSPHSDYVCLGVRTQKYSYLLTYIVVNRLLAISTSVSRKRSHCLQSKKSHNHSPNLQSPDSNVQQTRPAATGTMDAAAAAAVCGCGGGISEDVTAAMLLIACTLSARID